MTRRPIFELHIRPMFRQIDIAHMVRLPANKRIDLSSYDDVRAHHAKILTELRSASPMPTMATGGPWPAEWITLFERWGAEFGRLDVLVATDLKLQLTAPDRYLLTCRVAVPTPQSAAWFELQPPNRYQLVLERRGADGPKTLDVEERIKGPLPTNQIVVIDAAGEHPLPLPSA